MSNLMGKIQVTPKVTSKTSQKEFDRSTLIDVLILRDNIDGDIDTIWHFHVFELLWLWI